MKWSQKYQDEKDAQRKAKRNETIMNMAIVVIAVVVALLMAQVVIGLD